MSTSETIRFTAGECPCGKSEVAKYVTTQDNPWSTADIEYRVECETCAREWRLEGTTLILRSSETSVIDARSRDRVAYSQLRILVDVLVDDYFQNFSAPTKKAEHAEMTRLQVYSGSYRTFLKDKQNAQACSEIAYGLRNREWLLTLAAERGNEDRLLELLQARQQLQEAENAAAQQVVRRSVA